MLLVVDVGNTHTVLGLYEGERLVHDFRIETSKGRTSDEYHVLLLDLLALAGIDRSDIRASVLASVVPSFNDIFIESVDRAFDHEIMVVGPGIKTGMPVLYENPREVGADRIVNAVAAYERVQGAAIVVDFGTATTFDCISANGEYLGGAISPGMQISASALFAHAAKLPRSEIARPPRAIGRNTVHSMQAGIVFGYVGLVDGLVRRLAAEMKTEVSVIATGGLARLIEPESETIEEVDEYLTLEGLRLIYHRNA
ncbi:MAG: type III pantothenate kinase [Deltaproteobacteria bacterium]|nr:type III pantothenate kinase [Deltaproteobacteria bacterium]NND27393.1 type III pantothenate kinase [Myxococcales bacterium]MBT8465140.1 type III pantothenate kinase [Deltaproteobacteria bacterium]MBT8480211.1 type III pantothenate kinase [Deltaproteobacteria bacterium]NNK06266.1 type III pantothenate kinase [Myxococcales bacterium]